MTELTEDSACRKRRRIKMLYFIAVCSLVGANVWYYLGDTVSGSIFVATTFIVMAIKNIPR
jgi:hypothetical protein